MKWNQERMQELRVREINLSLPKGNVEGSLTEGEGKGGGSGRTIGEKIQLRVTWKEARKLFDVLPRGCGVVDQSVTRAHPAITDGINV